MNDLLSNVSTISTQTHLKKKKDADCYDIKILLVSVLSRNHPSSFDSISIVFKQR